MDEVDQRGFDNQPIEAGWVGAAQALEILGIKRKTLYAYVSRGLVRSVPSPDGRTRRYAREDLLRLRSRRESRSGHGPVAAAALRWGEPVLESAITEIRADGPWFRGRAAVALAAEGVAFEAVARLLWTGEHAGTAEAWHAPARLPPMSVPRGSAPLDAMLATVSALGLRDPHRFLHTPAAELARAGTIIRALAAAAALGRRAERVVPALRARGVASSLALALGARTDRASLSAIERALVVSADHELNASTFAARVAASAGADLYACILAALATLTGPRHGGASDRVEALLAEVGEPRRAREVVLARLRRGEAIPGFGHPLYARGDPRTTVLLEAARALPARRRDRGAALAAVIDAMAGVGEAPNVDVGLVAVVAALGLPPGSAVALFAVGRLAGTVAHVLEQRQHDFVLRPRARYVGPR